MNEYRVPSRELTDALENLDKLGTEKHQLPREKAIRLVMEINDLSKRINELLTKITELNDKEELV